MTLLACLMLEKVKLHQKFNKWPVHLTIVPWFSISPQNLSAFLASVQKASRGIHSITIKPKVLDYFGPKKDIRVFRVENNPKLLKLHYDLLKILDDCNAHLDSKKYTGNNFIPHVTAAGNYQLKKVVCRELYIICLHEKSMRQIVEIIKLD
jgi:2'-5' RNA ligase